MNERSEFGHPLKLAVAAGLMFAAPAFAQDPTPAVPPPPPAPDPTPSAASGGDEALATSCEEGGCCPPTAAQKLFIGVGDLALLGITFFLFVGLMERRFINTDRSPLLGRHLGMSLSLFLTAIGVGALAYLVTGCWPPEFTLWVIFAGVVWALHGIYTLIVVRGN